MVVRIEFKNKNKSMLTNINFQQIWKREMRSMMGVRVFVLRIPEDKETASLATTKKCKEVV